jgi:hypothetical protein
MGIDWDHMVLTPNISTFSNPVTFKPFVSQPGVNSYTNRAVWAVVPYTIMLENGMPMASSQYKLGLRLKDYAIPPAAQDHVVIGTEEYTLDAPEYDGQGGVMWFCKASSSGAQTHYVGE